MSKEVKRKQPPSTSIQSVQLDLFKHFITNDMSSVSNAVEAWESIPKYFLSPRQVAKLRTESGHADPYKWEYKYKGFPCTVKIQPALIEQEGGNYKAFFPSSTEEIIEECLKKILTEQQLGMHNPGKSETWVRFSLRMLYRELKARGKTRDIKEIKTAIEIMNKCIISFFKEGKEVWSGAILQDLVTVGREDYLSDSNSHHIARLPLFISHSINNLEYRQFNYERLMQCKEQLSRWIYKRLINRYRQASIMNTYHFMYSDIKQESGLLQQKEEKHNRSKIISALDELKEKQVVWSYKIDERKEGRKIIDIKYTINPSAEFVSEQKASNKRDNESCLIASKSNISVDNS